MDDDPAETRDPVNVELMSFSYISDPRIKSVSIV